MLRTRLFGGLWVIVYRSTISVARDARSSHLFLHQGDACAESRYAALDPGISVGLGDAVRYQPSEGKRTTYSAEGRSISED